jgi:NAD-dependent dihydropyrimidine dehydrogenase PreA subunit
MKTVIANFKKGLSVKSDSEKKYRTLQKHLDTMPIGYPSTFSGVELRLLEAMFTTEEAEAALNLSWRLETFAEIFKKASEKGYTEEKFRKLIESMESKGCIFTTVSGEQKRYSLHPLVIGMYEMQIKKMTPGLYLDLRDYVMKKFAMEYYATKVRQMRVIPIHQSVTAQLAVAAYDDIREIVDRTKDRIMITDCICRVGKDMVGQPCRLTDRREVCMGFRDFHDIYTRNGWGRSISKDEALKILDQNEKDGLVLMPATMQEPQYVCSCCGCCCGIIEMVSMLPRSADFVESNYRAVLTPETCLGCGKCEKRCQMGAIRHEDKKAVAIDGKKCIEIGRAHV